MENNQLSDKLLKQINPGIDFKRLLGALLSKWYWFVLCLFITLSTAYLYLRYTTPQYSIKSLVLIEDKNKSPASSILNKLSDNQSSGDNTGNTNLFNEMSMLTSQDLVELVVDSLDLNIRYWTKGRVKEEEIYETTPIHVVFDSNGYRGAGAHDIHLRQVVDGLFEFEEDKITKREMYDSWIVRPYGRFKIQYSHRPAANKGYLEEHTEIIVRIEPQKNAVGTVLSRFAVDISDGRTSLLDLAFVDNLPIRGLDFQNVLIHFYRIKELADLNEQVIKTREFIAKKKGEYIVELQERDSIEEAIKLDNQMVDVKSQAAGIIAEKNTEQQKIQTLSASKQAIVTLKQSVLDGAGARGEVLAGIGVADPFLSGLIVQYNTMVQAKENLDRNTAPLYPGVIKLSEDIAAQRKQIADACDRIIASLNVSLMNASRNVALSDDRMQSIPMAERSINDNKREYPLIQSVYLYLYQKDVENDIAQYAATNKSKVVVAPYVIDTPIKPIKKNVYMMMAMLGLLLPGSIVIARVLLNNKVINENDIESITTIPIIGSIARSTDGQKKNIVVGPHIRTGIAEQFRLIRANLEFMSAVGNKKVYLITSSMSGEGKTFISLNLGMTMTLAKKRVVVMEFDLRKPKLSSYLGLHNEGGISGYLAGMSGIEKVIKASGVHENLYIANCGPIPPNPGELLVLPSTQQLIEELHEMFDIIIMDTAPIGLVSDALILSQYSDINMFIIRQSYTVKDQIRLFDTLYKEKKIRNSAIIFNGVEFLKKYGYGYGGTYGYGYHYGGGYYTDEPKPKKSVADVLFKK